jgi:hypothetical protein
MFSAIDVAAGEKIPRKSGPGITRSDLCAAGRRGPSDHGGGCTPDAARTSVRTLKSEGRNRRRLLRVIEGGRRPDSPRLLKLGHISVIRQVR